MSLFPSQRRVKCWQSYYTQAQCVNFLVVQDIVGQMFDAKCVKELFRPQKVLSMKSLRIIFSKLAHSSIMKLNDAAMDKVYNIV